MLFAEASHLFNTTLVNLDVNIRKRRIERIDRVGLYGGEKEWTTRQRGSGC